MASNDDLKAKKKKSNWDAWNELKRKERENKKTNTASTKISSSIKRKIKKNTALTIGVIVFLVIGAIAGYFSYGYFCKNDCFEMIAYSNNEINVYIGPDENLKTYTELGVKCISFGKDISNKVNITYKYRQDNTFDAVEVESVDCSVAGVYYAIYKIDNIKFKNVTLIRTIFVLNQEV